MSTGVALDRTAARARTGTLVVFAANGFVFASWMSRVPDVKSRLHLSPGSLSLLLLAISVGAVLGLPLAGRIAHRIGAAAAVRVGAALVVPGVVLAAAAVQSRGPDVLVAAGLFLLGLGNGVWDVAQNLEGTVVERAVRRAIMPWFHAAFSMGTVAGALVGAGSVAVGVPVAVHVAVAAAIATVATVVGTGWFVPAIDDDGGDTLAATGGSAWVEPRTLLIGVMVLAAAFTEGTANDWLAVAFVDGHRVGKALGVVALAVFLAFMTVGRTLGTHLLDRHGRVGVLRVLFGAAVIGCLVVVFAPAWLAFAGAAVWGVGASLGFPVGMSAAADDPRRAATRLSVVSTVGYLAFLGGPPLVGFLGDHIGVLHSLLAVGAMSLLAIAIVPVARPLSVKDSSRLLERS